MPSYDTVREDTIAAGRDVIATFPASAQVVQQPDLEPYACDSDGYMYTGQWTVTLPTGAEMAPLLEALPDDPPDLTPEYPDLRTFTVFQ